MKITIDVDDALHARLRDAAEGGDLSVEEVALVLVARGIRDAYGDSTRAARLDAEAPVALTREQVRDLLTEGRMGRRAMEERIARRPPVADDSGRESREPARAAESAVDAVLNMYGLSYESTDDAVRVVRQAIDAAYARGALDMRTRAAAVASISDVAAVAAEIEALDVEVPQ